MNTIDWNKGKVYVYADRTGIIEVKDNGVEYVSQFEWYIDSCSNDHFYVGVDFEPISVYQEDINDYVDIPYEPYEQQLKEIIEREVNDDAYGLGLDTYHEDRYDFD